MSSVIIAACIEEAASKDVQFHKDIMYPAKKYPVQHPLEDGHRVTALISIDVVRNGKRRGDYFITDQQEVFEITDVTDWKFR